MQRLRLALRIQLRRNRPHHTRLKPQFPENRANLLDRQRRLIEQAGRKEIYMLIPLVFLILPLSVLFAVFPGIFMLRLGIG